MKLSGVQAAAVGNPGPQCHQPCVPAFDLGNPPGERLTGPTERGDHCGRRQEVAKAPEQESLSEL